MNRRDPPPRPRHLRELRRQGLWGLEGESGGTITTRCAAWASVDWSPEYFTMDEASPRWSGGVRHQQQGPGSTAAKRLNWGPSCSVRHFRPGGGKEDGSLWHIAYPYRPVLRKTWRLVVATTRPRPCWATWRDGASRGRARQHLIGRWSNPAAHRPPDPVVIADLRRPRVRHRRVKVTPAHDFNDYEVGPAPQAADDHRSRGAVPAVNDNARPPPGLRWTASGDRGPAVDGPTSRR